MRHIRISNSHLMVLVDDIDYPALSTYKWHLTTNPKSNQYYVQTKIKNKNVKMHRLLLNVLLVDHKDGNGLNNQRSNLRDATQGQQNHSRGIKENNTSGFKGVFWHKQRKCWQAKIGFNGKQLHLGLFDTKEQAALSYNQHAIKYYGEFANLNIII